MHRTESDGYILENGYRRFVSQSLPTYDGSTISGEWGNAVQEEIINVIEAAGLTVNPSESADRTDGWDQMKTALFDSEALDTTALADGAVTTDKISDCDLSKLTFDEPSGGIDITYIDGTESQQLQLHPSEISFIYENTSSNVIQSAVFGQSIYVRRSESSELKSAWDLDLEEAKTYGYQYPAANQRLGHAEDPINGYSHTLISSGLEAKEVRLNYNGLSFTDNFITPFKGVKCKVIDMDSGTWTGSGPYTVSYSTLLPFVGYQPLMAQFRYRIISTGDVYVARSTTSSGYDIRFWNSGGFWFISITVPVDLSGGSYDQRWAMIWYATV